MTERKYMLSKNGYWYRPDHKGYTGVVADAGLYSLDEALAATKHCGAVKYYTQAEVLETGLLPNLIMAGVYSCTCNTKTPVIDYHSPSCTYRILQEAYKIIKEGLVDGK